MTAMKKMILAISTDAPTAETKHAGDESDDQKSDDPA
jgi:hypothetical protein